MKITYLKPSMNGGRLLDAMPPLAFALLAALTPSDVEYEFYDERVEALPARLDTDLVAMSVDTFTARRAYRLAESCHKQHIPVVMGGIHPTLIPEEAGQYCDAVVVGDADVLWPQVIADVRNSRLRKIYRNAAPPDMRGLTFDRAIFEGKRYLPVVPVLYSRGCKFACEFCAIHAMYPGPPQHRPIAEVAAELKTIPARRLIFVDDNLFLDADNLREFCAALMPLQKQWAVQISLDCAKHNDLLQLLAQAGCVCLLIGFESLAEPNLRAMRKGINLGKEYAAAIKAIRAAGIMVWASFIVGYDADTPETLRATTEFVLQNKLFLAGLNPLLPFPGTPLYQRFLSENRLLAEKWWLDAQHQFGKITFRPKHFTPEALTKACLTEKLIIYNNRNIWRRGWDFQANCRNVRHAGVYLAANYLSRKEMMRKQGQAFG